jgi:adenosylmethionine-8-amino-7-oxononanoate aminotransferase
VERKGAFLEEAMSGFSGVLAVRRVGLILGIDVAGSGVEVCRRLRDHGVLTRPILDTVVLMPPLVVNDEELAFLVEVFGEVLGR